MAVLAPKLPEIPVKPTNKIFEDERSRSVLLKLNTLKEATKGKEHAHKSANI